MTAGNSHGLLVPASTTDEEMFHIRSNLPNGVKLATVKDTLTALGNCILCNDSIALIHPDMSAETEEIIEQTLQVRTVRCQIANSPLVGSFAILTNKAAMVHPSCSVQEIAELTRILSVPVCGGTVTRGSGLVGAGLVASDEVAIVGESSTGNEISIVDAVFGLNLQNFEYNTEFDNLY